MKLEKKFVRASRKPKLENYGSVQHRLQFSRIKKRAKISFHRHFKDDFKSVLGTVKMFVTEFCFDSCKTLQNVIP